MKKKLAILMACLIVAGSFAGCSGGNDAPANDAPADTAAEGTGDAAAETPAAADGEEVIINIYDWDIGFDTSIIDRFNEANPGIKAVFNTVPDNNDKTTKLDILAMGGGEIDVMPMADGDQFMRMRNGMLAPITDYVSADGIDMVADYGVHGDWCQVDGTYYGLPLRVNIEGVFYNKDMFDAAGVAYPDENWTLAEYEEIAGKLVQGEGPNKVYGTYTHVWSGVWNTFGCQKASYYTADGQCNFADPAIVGSLEFRKKMDDLGYQQSFNQINAVNAMPNSAFLGEQCAMGTIGSWLVRDMKDKERFPFDFNVGWNYAPRFDDSLPAKQVQSSVSMLGIPATSKNPEAAWKFMRFYIEENAMAIAASGNIPCYQPAYTDELIGIYIEGSGFDLEEAKKIFDPEIHPSSSKVGVPPDSYAADPQYSQIIDEETELYFNGEQDLDTTVNNVVEKAAKAIEEAA